MDLEKAPYFVVLTLSAFGWLAGYFYETTINQPIIEFDVFRGSKSTTVELENLTSDKTFHDVSIWVRPKSDNASQFTGNISPLGYGDPTGTSFAAYKQSAKFSLSAMYPGVRYRAKLEYPTGTVFTVFLTSQTDAVRFTERGLLTWMIRNGQDLMIWTFLLSGLVLAIYVLAIARARSSADTLMNASDPPHSNGGGSP